MRFIKKFFGVVLCVCAFGFTVATEQVEQNIQPFFIVLVLSCVIGAVLLLKKPRQEKVKIKQSVTVEGKYATIRTEYTPSEVPADIAKDMRKHYTIVQARRDAEIMAESFKIASSTTNLDTFCMRYNLAMQKAHTLLQAEEVGVRGMKKLKCHNACLSVIDAITPLRVRVLNDYAQEAFAKAEELKTDKGKHNRYIKMLETLEKAEPTFMFMEEYTALLEKVKAIVFQPGSSGK